MTTPPRRVTIEPYRAAWTREFAALEQRISDTIGAAALRIDHIGSTAVPGLGAKDIIDLQITVADLERAETVTEPLREAGFRRGEAFVYDCYHELPPDSLELRKRYLREPDGERRVHVHIREHHRFNQRFALLVRDYLRASADARDSYEREKREAAAQHPEDIAGYLRLKEPVFARLYQDATAWAARTA